MITANRLAQVGEYYFSKKLQEVATLNAQGKSIINLGIGSPDMPPHPSVIAELSKYAHEPHTHSYQGYKGIPALRAAIAHWYSTQYNANLNANTQVLPLMGSKEGILHLCMAYLNPGDVALIPNPGYPTYASAVQLAGGICMPYHLESAQGWLPNFNAIEAQDLSKVKLMFVNYPHMPTGAPASPALLQAIIQFGAKHNILIINDNPYSFILNPKPLSILTYCTNEQYVVELNSLSKSNNMAGWRVGMLCGNSNVLQSVLQYKSNMDSGMYLPIQLAAIKALEMDSNWYHNLNQVYATRKQHIQGILTKLQCTFEPHQQGLFVWAKINISNYKDGYHLSDHVLYNHNVFITPGGIFGSNGNNYVRVSICQPEHVIAQAATNIAS